MRSLRFITAITILSAAIPTAALADLSGTVTLPVSQTVNLETGVTAYTGGDLLWNGVVLSPQPGAAITNVGTGGQAAFSALTAATISVLPYSATPIQAVFLTVNDVFAVKNTAGHFVAVLVTAVSGTALTLQYTAFGASGTAGPVISQVLNNFGLVQAGFPNYGIAPGTLFIIKGTGLATAGSQAVLQSSSGSGLPLTLNGASVKVSVNGVITTPAFYYAIPTQLALVMPSNTPVGAGTVTVTNNAQNSLAFPVSIVSSAMGFDAYYGTGSGLGVATDAVTGALYDYGNSIPPGTTVTMWGSGLGADAARDRQYAPAIFAINGLAHVYVGGVDAPIYYQGASGFPGVNQVDVTIPVNAPKGCNVSVVGVTAAGVPTNFVTLPIGTGPCADPLFGLSGSQTQALAGQATVKTGVVSVSHSIQPATGGGTQTVDVAFAGFQSATGAAYGAAGSGVSSGGCMVTQTLAGTGGGSAAGGLDAGASIAVTGPGVPASATLTAANGLYLAQLLPGFLNSAGGSYTFTGSGGKDVGAFMATVGYPTPVLQWTNQSAGAAVTRSAGVQVTWNGGAAGSFVSVIGTSTGLVNGQSVTGTFQCITPASAIQLTVPAYITAAMPAGTGTLVVNNYAPYQTFTAPGLDFGVATSYVSYLVNSKYN